MTEHAPSRSRLIAAALALCAFLGTALAGTVVLAGPAEAATTFTASRTTVIGGESVRLTGSIGRQPRRKVVLQRKIGTRWVKVTATTSTRRGAFAFTVRPPGAAGTRNVYRARAPRTSTRPAVTTTARAVVVVAQTAVLTAPAAVTAGVPFATTATFRPARPGRIGVLQRLVGSTWTEVARGVQSSTGAIVLHPTLTSTGATSLRVVAQASQGAPAKASSARTVAVLPVMARASVSAGGVQADGVALEPAISANGRYVAFSSSASTLVPGDTNGVLDVFVRDRVTNVVERISVTANGGQVADGGDKPAISADGRYVAFLSTADLAGAPNDVPDVFVKDRLTGAIDLVSAPAAGLVGAGWSSAPSISADGRYVAFGSAASNLVPGDTNGAVDAFVRDRTAGTTVRITLGSGGVQANGPAFAVNISADGQYVAYASLASNLVAGDTNGKTDVFRWSRASQSSRRVSETAQGVEANDISGAPWISADGRYVTFSTAATNLTASDATSNTDVLVWDAADGALDLTSLTGTGTQVHADAGPLSVSADARYVLFFSDGAFTPNDTNGLYDLYVRDRQLDTVRLVSIAADGALANGNTLDGSLSADGQTLALNSAASNLVPADTNNVADVFVRDLRG